MEIESFVLSVSLFLEVFGAANIMAFILFRGTKWAPVAEISLVGCICGLGSVTIAGAILHLFCGLIAGMAVVAIGLAVVFMAEHHHAEENPFGPLFEAPVAKS